MPREEVVEAHGGLAVHGGGDVGVGIGCLPHRGVPEHLRDQFQLFLVLEDESSEGVPKKRVKPLSPERIGGKTSPARAQYLRLPRRGEIGSEL